MGGDPRKREKLPKLAQLDADLAERPDKVLRALCRPAAYLLNSGALTARPPKP